MGFGGPVWHASVAGSIIKAVLEREALRQLEGVGDASLGEWREPGEKAFHVRRRLSAAEQKRTGLTVADIRRTPEAAERAAMLGGRLALVPPEVLAEEIGA
jgi:hypothetical protein